MKTRAYRAEDREQIAAIHEESGFDYRLPELDGPRMAAMTVCEDDKGIIAAAALQLQPEAYLWIRKDADPRAKWDAIRMIQRELVKQIVKLGYGQIVAYIPPCLRFAKRLRMLRWVQPRDGWSTWVYEVKP